MWWNRKSKPAKTRREELIDAREKLSRQIELLNINPGYNSGNMTQIPELIAELQIILVEIEAELNDG